MNGEAPISRPRIAQCLCPRRHCIVAVAYETLEDEVVLVGLRRHVEACLHADLLEPWCIHCGASVETWSYEAAAWKQLAQEPLYRASPHRYAAYRWAVDRAAGQN